MDSTGQSVWDLVAHVWILGLPLIAWVLLLVGLFCTAIGTIYLYSAWWRRRFRFWDHAAQRYEDSRECDWSGDWWDQ